eukprot:gene20101-1038_t
MMNQNQAPQQQSLATAKCEMGKETFLYNTQARFCPYNCTVMPDIDCLEVPTRKRKYRCGKYCSTRSTRTNSEGSTDANGWVWLTAGTPLFFVICMCMISAIRHCFSESERIY